MDYEEFAKKHLDPIVCEDLEADRKRQEFENQIDCDCTTLWIIIGFSFIELGLIAYGCLLVLGAI